MAKRVQSLTFEEKRIQNLSKQQIGRLGELLVQFELLRYGIESAFLTTDAGIDLVAYTNTRKQSVTIQVKTNLKPKPGGGKGSLGVDWWVADNCPAYIYALVDISSRRIWLFTREELEKHAQQRPEGKMHLYMSTQPGTLAYEKHGASKFARFLLEESIKRLFF